VPYLRDALEGAVVEDVRKRRPVHEISRGLELAEEPSFFAERGYLKVTKAIYAMGRDGKAYARVREDSRGEDLVVHIVRDLHSEEENYLFMVERGGGRHVLNLDMVKDVLRRSLGRLPVTQDDIRELARKHFPSGEDGLARYVTMMVTNPVVARALPKSMAEKLKEHVRTKEQERKRRMQASVSG